MKELETDLSYLLKDKQEIEESLKEGPNGFLADKLAVINTSIRHKRNELSLLKTKEKITDAK